MSDEQIKQMVDEALAAANTEDDLDDASVKKNATRKQVIVLCYRLRDLLMECPVHPAAEKHRLRHVELHKAFDELLADYLRQNHDKRPTNTTVMELLIWSSQQARCPTP